MEKNLVVAGAVILLAVLPTSFLAKQQLDKPIGFAKWCQQKQSAPVDTRHTIEVLLKKVGTNDCEAAEHKLDDITELSLNNAQIIDIQPLAGLTNLTLVDLSSNHIVDLKPLAGLWRVSNLTLSNNRISNLQPLAGLINLSSIELSNNQISDLQPLAGLSKLSSLTLSNNRIVNLQNNPIGIKTCPIERNICEF